MTFADRRLQTADRRPQTADRRLQTADCMRQEDCKLNETKNIVIKVASLKLKDTKNLPNKGDTQV